ncbi:hypothetical protein BJ875DRAFT_187189 [Amylocarpus encephaloides]|uniref:F-box domain-containing protein n=1 Tax=Amylocarpus encephaloides TaxID=45428 RepID=A0A9P8C0S4_9HELO|nr:hypothetical protein BJ875DRAFT_187189 [Amylocarpus encephaloides]
MLGLVALPYEVLSIIAESLNIDDFFNLGISCKVLHFLILDDSLAKKVILKKIPHSPEAIRARNGSKSYAKALRRAAKRRNGISTAYPYTVSTVGFCDAYLYCKGTLCYALDESVRILDLHNSSDHEIVVSIPGLISEALPNVMQQGSGDFQVMYYADRIVSCLWETSLTAWLVAFNLESGDILVAEELDSIERLFVRHNGEYLYYGNHSEIDRDGHKKWSIYGYDFCARKWFPEKVYLSEMAGYDIGSTVCFEFYENYFYALSNQTSFEVEEIDWTSFYHCYRFPLDSPAKSLLEMTNEEDMWRRQHQEGPIDDRWMSLQLDVDECSGELKIVESRKEWYVGSSQSQRNYYTTDIIFPKADEEGSLYGTYQVGSECKQTDFIESPILDNASASFPTSYSGSSTQSQSVSQTEATASSSTATTPYTPHPLFDNNRLPNSQLLRLRKKENNPHYLDAPLRCAHKTHYGDDGSVYPTFTIVKTRIRTYFRSCNTFMDVVDDPLASDWKSTQRLRLRAGSRRLGSPLLDKTGLLRACSSDIQTAQDELYVNQGIRYWPDLHDSNYDPELEEVYTLLNPPSHLGEVAGTADDRSFVYVTGPRDKPRALIFVGFDAGIRLKGLRRWSKLEKKSPGVGEGPHVDGTPTACAVGASLDPRENDRNVAFERKGKEREGVVECIHVDIAPTTQCPPSQPHLVDMEAMICTDGATFSNRLTRDDRNSWIWQEKPMYQDIHMGLNFGKAPYLGSA